MMQSILIVIQQQPRLKQPLALQQQQMVAAHRQYKHQPVQNQLMDVFTRKQEHLQQQIIVVIQNQYQEQ